MKSPPPEKVAGGSQITPLQFTINDTARLLSISPSTVRRFMDKGELASVGQGKLRRVPLDSIVAYQNRHRNDEVT